MDKSEQAESQQPGWGLLQINQVALEYKNYALFNDKQRDLLIYPEFPKEGINVIINLDALKYFYFDNLIHATTTGGQYRAIGLEVHYGLRLSDALTIGGYHHSQHLLDRNSATLPAYPSNDALEIRIQLFKSKTERPGVF